MGGDFSNENKGRVISTLMVRDMDKGDGEVELRIIYLAVRTTTM